MNLKEKKILILGANPETAGLVIKANELGLDTYVTDYDPKAYAKQFAKHPCNIDASAVDELYELAVKEKIDGVLVGVAERLLPAYYALCVKLGYPCFGDPDIFNLMIDKKQFKSVCRKYDVPVVQEYNFTDYKNDLRKIELPVVVKPVDSCSSKGISVCKTYDELEKGVEKALSFSVSKTILIEKYMTGDEVVVYYVIQNGEPTCVAMCDRYTNKEEQRGFAQLPTAYLYPSIYIHKYLAETDTKVKNMLRNVGVKNGVLFLQGFIEKDNVRFYEPGFRLNGAQEHYLVSAITGIDAKELLINFALTGQMSGDSISTRAKPNFEKLGCKLSPLVKTGRIKQLSGLDEISEIKEVVSVNPSYREGDSVDGKGTLKQIVCRFFIVADTAEKMKETIEQIYQKLVVLDDDGNSMLLKPFDTSIVTAKYRDF